MADWNLLKLFARAREGASSSSATSEALVIGRKSLKPDPRMMQAIGRNHSFESAVADIVDNSLDAGASRILVRFMRDQSALVGLYVVDDGRGMTDSEIDRAMTFGGRREYAVSDLGHFGIGLKAASLGQARTLTVVSRASSKNAVGRRLVEERVTQTFECEVLSSASAKSVLDRSWGHVAPNTGTAVMWSEVKRFPTIVHGETVDAYLDRMTGELCRHLGLVFHRLITTRGVSIIIDQEDIGTDETGPPFVVEAIDPFAYVKSGRNDYPRTLVASNARGRVSLLCHIWPGRSNDASFRLKGGRPSAFQGFFIYRNDRLIQTGGWQNVTAAREELQLARVAVDIPADAAGLFELNPEKTLVEATDLFRHLAGEATDGQVNFAKFLEDATNTYRESRKRERKRPRVLKPGSGIAPEVKSALADEYEFDEGREPLSVRWDKTTDGVFFEIDKEANVVRLNKNYRSLFLGDDRAGLNDAPLIKALVYLLVEATMRGDMLGPRDKDNLAIWQAVLTAAAETQNK
jgi:hypothetical protein